MTCFGVLIQGECVRRDSLLPCCHRKGIFVKMGFVGRWESVGIVERYIFFSFFFLDENLKIKPYN